MSVTFSIEAIYTGKCRITAFGDDVCEAARQAVGRTFTDRREAYAIVREHDGAMDDCWPRDCASGLLIEGIYDVDAEGVNFANGNARVVLEFLGIDSPDLLGSMGGGDFLAACQVAMATGTPVVHARPATETVGDRGARFVDFGIDEAGIVGRVSMLADLATEAVRLGRDVTWG